MVDVLDANPTVNGAAGPTRTGTKINYYYVNASRTLVQIEMFMKPAASVPLNWYVLEASSTSGPWTAILQNHTTTSTTGQGYQSSGTINVPLLGNHYYAIAVQWAASVDYWYHTPGSVPISFGIMNGGDMFPATQGAPTIAYALSTYYFQRLTTIP